MPPKVDPN